MCIYQMYCQGVQQKLHQGDQVHIYYEGKKSICNKVRYIRLLLMRNDTHRLKIKENLSSRYRETSITHKGVGEPMVVLFFIFFS